MKILFVNNFIAPDYMNDMVYHGFVSTGHEVYETAYPTYMLSSHPEPEKLYGKGFTMYARMTHQPNIEDGDEIIYKIAKRYYDLIIFGSVVRDRSYLGIIKKFYPKHCVHFIDGEDLPEFNVPGLENYGTYWKREMGEHQSFKPISFGIPKSQLISTPAEKEKLFAHIVPGKLETYIFNNEQDYYRDYAISYYGITNKKAGWDCMRHYEILANRCIPYFSDLQACPKNIMANFPKKTILEVNKYAERGVIPSFYDEINEQLFEYTKNNLTTEKIANTIIATYK